MIRPYREEDFEVVSKFWFDATAVATPELIKRMGHELDGSRYYFRNVIVPENQTWVYEMDKTPVGFLGLQGEYIDRLYVDPAFHRRGVGQALLAHAQQLSPHHLWLKTHAVNQMARAFYEKNGFIAEKFGVSDPPESEPDVEYHWYPK